MRLAAAVAWIAPACGVRTVIVSKNGASSTVKPSFRNPAASVPVNQWTRRAMARNPSGPWYTAYIDAMTASSTCAVQMLLVALSRRMCCSRVCRLRR